MIESIKVKKETLKKKEKEINEELEPIQKFFRNNVHQEELEKEAIELRAHLEEIKQNKKEIELQTGISKKQMQFIEREFKRSL